MSNILDHAWSILAAIGAFSGGYFTLKESARNGLFGKAIGNSVLYRDLRKLLVNHGTSSFDADAVVLSIRTHIENPRSVFTWERK